MRASGHDTPGRDQASSVAGKGEPGCHSLHYLNPVPLRQISERWIDKHQRRIPRALSELEEGLEMIDLKKA